MEFASIEARMRSSDGSKQRGGLVDRFIPQAFRDKQLRDTPAIHAAWQRFTDDGNKSDFDALLTFYLPMVMIAALMLRKRHPYFYIDEVDELCSDGVFGLMKAIRSQKPGQTVIFKRLKIEIMRAMRRATVERHYGGEDRMERMGVVAGIRRAMVQQLGRAPSDDEMLATLRWQITNPQLYVGNDDLHQAKAFSQLEKQQRKQPILESIGASQSRRPDAELIDDETLKLALKGLRGDDRKMFKMFMEGVVIKEIGRRFGLSWSAMGRRMNGIFWETRCRRDLADYLNVEPAPAKPLCKPSLWPATSTLPAARKIA